MKKIQPVQTWSNGESVNATALSISLRSDNLVDSAQFDYILFTDINGLPLLNSTLTMNGEDYVNFTSNEYAWTWAAAKLNLTLVSE
jgi:hypothetical protein